MLHRPATGNIGIFVVVAKLGPTAVQPVSQSVRQAIVSPSNGAVGNLLEIVMQSEFHTGEGDRNSPARRVLAGPTELARTTTTAPLRLHRHTATPLRKWTFFMRIQQIKQNEVAMKAD